MEENFIFGEESSVLIAVQLYRRKLDRADIFAMFVRASNASVSGTNVPVTRNSARSSLFIALL